MKIEQQVCPLAVARRLKELGVEQDSQFYWVEHPLTHEYQVWFGEVLWCGEDDANRRRPMRHVSAFTVAELGEMLPAVVGGGDARACCLNLSRDALNRWHARYISPDDPAAVALMAGGAHASPESDQLAASLARLLVQLLESTSPTRTGSDAR